MVSSEHKLPLRRRSGVLRYRYMATLLGRPKVKRGFLPASFWELKPCIFGDIGELLGQGLKGPVLSACALISCSGVVIRRAVQR